MRRPAVLAVLTSALGCGASPEAREPVSPSAPESPAADTEQGGPILWRLEGPAGSSYLFGTLHLGLEPDDIGDEVLAALRSCDTFIAETDLDEVDPLEAARIQLLPPGETLQNALGPETFDALVHELGPRASRAHLDKLRPFVAYSEVLRRIYPSRTSIDRRLIEIARDAGKKLIFLEDWRFQYRLIASIIGAEDVKQILDPGSRERRQLDTMITAYRRGDFATIERLTTAPELVGEDPESFAALFDTRNRAWLPILVEQLRAGRVFVAVGAGHFGGEAGLLALLAEHGFTARRVGARAEQ
jgi:uncharacterized protein YbaP (TraB family)